MPPQWAAPEVYIPEPYPYPCVSASDLIVDSSPLYVYPRSNLLVGGNSNAQAGIGQLGGINSNSQDHVNQQIARPLIGRRQNSNVQSNVDQSGWGNSNVQGDVGQSQFPLFRRQNSNEQRAITQSGWGNSNIQGGVGQAARGYPYLL